MGFGYRKLSLGYSVPDSFYVRLALLGSVQAGYSEQGFAGESFDEGLVFGGFQVRDEVSRDLLKDRHELGYPGSGDADLLPEHLSLSRIRELFDKVLISVPTGSILLTGGEPLMRGDLEDIVEYFSSKNLKVGIATNGFFLDKERTRSLVEVGVSQFEVTVLSANEEAHDRLSGVQGSYQRACQAILNVKNLKKQAFVGFPAISQNIEEAPNVFDLAFALGADGFSFYRFVPTGKGSQNSHQFMPTVEQINDALGILDEKADILKMRVFLGIPVPLKQLNKKLKNIKITKCEGGLTKFVIDCRGNLRICEQNPDIIGSLFNNNFLSLVLDKKVRGFRKTVKDSHGNCPLLLMN